MTEAPQTQIYFTNHGPGAFLEVRLRTVVRGEWVSRSIVDGAQRVAQAYANWVPAEAGDTLGSVGYADGDRCAFTYLGQAQEDLHQEFQAAEEVELSSSDSSDDEDPRSPRPNRSPVR